jgi:hypothetical protein
MESLGLAEIMSFTIKSFTCTLIILTPLSLVINA